MTGRIRKTDTQIHHDVLEELKWDSRVDETDVGVEVDDGVVTLLGTVKSWPKRAAAEEAARRVSGVLDVANDIKVVLPAARAVGNLAGVRSVDNRILVRRSTTIASDVRTAIEAALERRAEREARRIRVDVHDGTVTLEGDVHSWAERTSVLAAARFTPGVRAVEDQLRMQYA